MRRPSAQAAQLQASRSPILHNQMRLDHPRTIPMSSNPIDTHLDAALVDGKVAVTASNGLRASLSLEAARDLAERLIELTEDRRREWREAGDTYQKPLG